MDPQLKQSLYGEDYTTGLKTILYLMASENSMSIRMDYLNMGLHYIRQSRLNVNDAEDICCDDEDSDSEDAFNEEEIKQVG